MKNTTRVEKKVRKELIRTGTRPRPCKKKTKKTTLVAVRKRARGPWPLLLECLTTGRPDTQKTPKRNKSWRQKNHRGLTPPIFDGIT